MLQAIQRIRRAGPQAGLADFPARLTPVGMRSTPDAHLRPLIAGRKQWGAPGSAPGCPSAACPRARCPWPRRHTCAQSGTHMHKRAALALFSRVVAKHRTQLQRASQEFTQQRAKWSWSSANRRPMHILFPMPNGRCANGLIFLS